MHNFRKILAWQKAIEFTEEIYRYSQNFPKQETYGLTSQLRRAAVSIPSNIAEGSGKSSNKDFARYLEMALGSAFEVETQLIIAKRLAYISEDEFVILSQNAQEIQKLIIGFKRSL